MLGHHVNLMSDFAELDTDLLDVAELVRSLNGSLAGLQQESQRVEQSLSRLSSIFLLLLPQRAQDRRIQQRLLGLLMLKLAAEIGEHYATVIHDNGALNKMKGQPQEATIKAMEQVNAFIKGEIDSLSSTSQVDLSLYNHDLLAYGEDIIDLVHSAELFMDTCAAHLDLLHRVAVMYTTCYEESYYHRTESGHLEERLGQFFFFCCAGEIRKHGRLNAHTLGMLTTLTSAQKNVES